MGDIRKIVVIIFSLFNLGTSAQYNCIFEHISTEKGLSHGSVSAMLKDKQGFMWFATWDGVCRYDGHNFKTFKYETLDNGTFVSNRIESLQTDSLGNIWVLTHSLNVLRYNYINETMQLVPQNSSNNDIPRISGIHPFGSGDVWLTTFNKGIFRVATKEETNNFLVEQYHTKSAQKLPDNAINFVVEDTEKNVWINTEKGLAYLLRDTIQNTFIRKYLTSSFKQVISSYSLVSYCLSGYILYFGTYEGDLLIVNPQNMELRVKKLKNNKPINTITASLGGTLYLGTSGNGLFEYNVRSGKIARHFNQPIIRNVLKSYADLKGNLWVESDQAGISKIDLSSGAFKHFTQKLDVPADIRGTSQCGIMEDENKTLWLTLKGGGFGYYDSKANDVQYFYNDPENSKSKL